MQARTYLLLAFLTALFGVAGLAAGGREGMIIALGLALVMNLGSYWFSDRLALAAHGAQEVGPDQAPQLYALVGALAGRAGLPMPRVCVIPTDQPNAFATGRNPDNAAVAVTHGLLNLLNERELAAVIAHELGHIRNRDTLVMTIAASLAGALASLTAFGMRGSRNVILSILAAVLAPLAASLIQMAISRTREFGADAAGAQICGDPMALAEALQKIDAYARGTYNPAAESHPATAHMFIINPLSGEGIASLFSTHPPTEARVAALVAQAQHAYAAYAQPPVQGGPWGGRR